MVVVEVAAEYGEVEPEVREANYLFGFGSFMFAMRFLLGGCGDGEKEEAHLFWLSPSLWLLALMEGSAMGRNRHPRHPGRSKDIGLIARLVATPELLL